jgi:hypothetical protein
MLLKFGALEAPGKGLETPETPETTRSYLKVLDIIPYKPFRIVDKAVIR